MTREELREHLAVLTGERTDDDTVVRVDAITNAFDTLHDNLDVNATDYQALLSERDQLRQELADEKERFKNRFWGRDDTGAPSPAPLANTEQPGAPIFASPEELADIWK